MHGKLSNHIYGVIIMVSLRLTASVGIGGKNAEKDVKIIQQSLNKILGSLKNVIALKVDGKLGSRPEKSKTVEAIKVFQKSLVGMARPDGLIEVNGRSLRKLSQLIEHVEIKRSIPLSGAIKLKLKERFEYYEGRVGHMYLDTRGFVTVGVGSMLSSISEAEKLPFVNITTGHLATLDEIKAEFLTIKSRPFGQSEPAYKFKPFTKLMLTDNFMNEQVMYHIQSFEKELKIIYGNEQFSEFPENVKLALFDMIFNLGMPKLRDSYPKFNDHIRNGNYVQAAQECNRNGVQAERNAYVSSLLRSQS